MDRDRLLVRVSSAQLAVGLAGMAVAVTRRHPYDVGFMHGRPETVARDTVLMGTAFSAPCTMLATQAVATAALMRAPSARARCTVGGLGTTMVSGYLAERLVRQRLRPSGWHPLETPLAVAGIALAAAMGVLGLAS